MATIPQQNKKTTLDIEIKAVDMQDIDIDKFKGYVTNIFSNYHTEEHIAQMLKQELDKNETLGWNVVVGKDFGSHVFHQTKKYIYLRVLELYVLIWKS